MAKIRFGTSSAGKYGNLRARPRPEHPFQLCTTSEKRGVRGLQGQVHVVGEHEAEDHADRRPGEHHQADRDAEAQDVAREGDRDRPLEPIPATHFFNRLKAGEEIARSG